MKALLKGLFFPFIFILGFLFFIISNKTPSIVYASFRYMFVITNGGINDLLSIIYSWIKPLKIKKAEGLIGHLNENKINEICTEIRKNGYYIFEGKLGDDDITKLNEYSLNTKTRCVNINKPGVNYYPEKILFNPENPQGPRYQFDSPEIIQNETIRKIVFDQSFLCIATQYLKCNPILDIVTMWWSIPFENKGASQAAQMYHFDMDRIKFLKFFIYLTDVDTNSGPHCYIRKTNIRIPGRIRKDRRIDDQELVNYFSKKDIIEFNGKKGTILAIDTRGLHKGKPLLSGKRLLFQIQFSNSLFGAPYTHMPISNSNETEIHLMKKYPRTYQLLN